MIAEPKKPPAIRKPIITLTTDFGTQDYYVGAMKGAILETNPNVSGTFHGRDIFAPVAAHLAKIMSAEDFGTAVSDFARIPIPKPQPIGDKQIKGFVLLADRFGNLITNIEMADLQAFMQSRGF